MRVTLNVMPIAKAVITAAGPDQRSMPLQRFVDRDGEVRSALHIILNEASSAGVSSTTFAFLRRVFNDGDAPEVESHLLPLCNMCLAGTIAPEAMDFLMAGRVVLIPKAKGPSAPGEAPAQPVAPDFRPPYLKGN